MNRIREKKIYWIGGSAAAFSGVVLVKLVAPDLSGSWQQALQVAGYVLVFAGLAIISCATRRQKDEEFVEVPEKSNKKNRPFFFRRMP
ncbi:MAG: hypothetical protein ABFD75_16200 [Smithella sp.]